MNISRIVLAGGKSLRLGCDKASEAIGNRSLLHWVVFNLASFDSDVIIVAAKQQSFLQCVNYPKLKVVADTYPAKGPLGGIYTGLSVSSSFHNLIVACDMPFLNRTLLSYMIQLSADFDLVIPRLGNLVEPLHAVYSKDCLTAIEYQLKQGNLRIAELFSMVRVRYVEFEEINRFDPGHSSFFNVNTKADLNMARELVGTNDKC